MIVPDEVNPNSEKASETTSEAVASERLFQKAPNNKHQNHKSLHHPNNNHPTLIVTPNSTFNPSKLHPNQQMSSSQHH
jgi:hypothetical protein